MRKVQLYINDKRVDLYKDEKIQVTSTIQNTKDISKCFTDFSTSFTVPCSNNNNDIFSFFYNNDFDGTFNAKNRAPARIEIDHSPFRRGKVQLEGSVIKNNNPESYKITFYGDVVSLKDLFGEDKLKDLDYSSIALGYTAANVSNAITNTGDLDVRFPLISSNRVWTYGDGANTDISNNSYPLVWNELFPAIKDKVIFDRIAAKYGLTFNSNFLDSDYFKKSFTYFKNADVPYIFGEPENIEFNDSTSGSTLTNNQINIQYSGGPTAVSNQVGNSYHIIRLLDITLSVNTSIYIDVFKNDVLLSSVPVTYSGTPVDINLAGSIIDQPGLDDVYKLQARIQNTACNITAAKVNHRFISSASSGGTFATTITEYEVAITAPLVLTNNIGFSNLAPEMKVSDWFSGMLRMFNLVCYPTFTNTHFQIEPLQDWYSFGGELDITGYTDVKSIKVDRNKLPKLVSFEYQKSKAFLNETFLGQNGQNYGDLKSQFPYDGKDFKVKLPFENMLFTKFTGTNLQVSYALDKASGGKSYIPKPVKLFMDQTKSITLKFNDGSSTSTLSSYMPMGQDLFDNAQDFSQNFGYELSSLKDTLIGNSLYRTFYENYMVKLFDKKSRKVTVKCLLPIKDLTTLTLDDSIILRDKKYTIDSMKTDLTTGEVEFVLLSNFETKKGIINTPVEEISSDAGSLNLSIKMLKPPNPTKMFDGGGGYVTLGATRETQFITFSLPVTYTTERNIDIVIPRNTTGSSRGQSIPVTYYDASGTAFATTDIVIKQAG